MIINVINSIFWFLILYLYRIIKKEKINEHDLILILVLSLNPFLFFPYVAFLIVYYFENKEYSIEKAIVIKNGILNFSAICKLNYSLDKLFSDIKEAGFNSIDEIDYAILEAGTLSFIK